MYPYCKCELGHIERHQQDFGDRPPFTCKEVTDVPHVLPHSPNRASAQTSVVLLCVLPGKGRKESGPMYYSVTTMYCTVNRMCT